jgi:hypothetical protein
MEGIVYHPNGEISVGFDGQTWRLAPPKLGVYRRFSERLAEMRRAIQQVSEQIVLLREQLTQPDVDIDQIRDSLDKLNAPIWEYSLPIIRDMVTELAGQPLPDPDEWPAWLATSISLPSDILEHWRTVPKAPGVAETK